LLIFSNINEVFLKDFASRLKRETETEYCDIRERKTRDVGEHCMKKSFTLSEM
jgi:hypothetical protein